MLLSINQSVVNRTLFALKVEVLPHNNVLARFIRRTPARSTQTLIENT